MDTNADQVAKSVARVLAPDVPYIQPIDSRHFVSESVLLALGGALVGAFAKGVVSVAMGEAEAWGARCASWLRDRIQAAFSGDSHGYVDDPAIVEVVTELHRVVRTLDREHIVVYTETSSAVLTTALRDIGLPPASAKGVVREASEIIHGAGHAE